MPHKNMVIFFIVFFFLVLSQTSDVFATSLIVHTDKTQYEYGDHLTIIFKASEIKDKSLSFQIRDNEGKSSPSPLVEIHQLKTEITAPVPFYSNIWKPGTYYIDASYAGSSSTASFSIIDSGKIAIPYWVKDIIGSWSEGQYADKDCARQIKYLVDENIISIPELKNQPEHADAKIPSWVKNNAKWWIANQITDTDFALGIQYLLKTGIIVV